MVDVNPEIWNNRTLGEAAHNERLDRLEKQQHEDRAARLEDREPREVVVENTYPDWAAPTSDRTGTVPSNYTPVHFADENPHELVQTGIGQKPEGMSDEEWEAQTEAPSNSNGNYDPSNDPGEEVSNGGEESDSTESSETVETEEPSDGFLDQSESTEPDSTEESDSTKWT